MTVALKSVRTLGRARLGISPVTILCKNYFYQSDLKRQYPPLKCSIHQRVELSLTRALVIRYGRVAQVARKHIKVLLRTW